MPGVDVEQDLAFSWEAINNLPAEDEWPWLINGMFFTAPERVGYRCRLVDFAAARNGVDEVWEEWLDRFEN